MLLTVLYHRSRGQCPISVFCPFHVCLNCVLSASKLLCSSCILFLHSYNMSGHAKDYKNLCIHLYLSDLFSCLLKYWIRCVPIAFANPCGTQSFLCCMLTAIARQPSDHHSMTIGPPPVCVCVKSIITYTVCVLQILVNVTLRLLLNLTFDPNLRLEMVKVGLLPKLVALLSKLQMYGNDFSISITCSACSRAGKWGGQ